MQSLLFISKIENGCLFPKVLEAFNKALKNFEGDIVKITLEKSKKNRSLNQNAYYWGVVIQYILDMFREAGNDVNEEEVHLYLKQHIGKLTKVIVEPNGSKKLVLQSTAKLNTKDFEDYLERIRAWAAGLGVVIPLPKENF